MGGVPTDPEERKAYMRALGAKGGRSRSPKKLAAVRLNGRKGKGSALKYIQRLKKPLNWKPKRMTIEEAWKTL